MRMVEAEEHHLDELAKLAMALWPENNEDELKEEYRDMLNSCRHRIVLAQADGTYVAFIHVSLRYDYVEGADSSPVGYVEGIYVRPEYRRRGIARKLIEHGEQWALSMGCSQFASDIEHDNTESYEFHVKAGFREAGRMIAFIKDLKQE